MSDTLVLSCGYEPLGRISWQRAITLIFQNKVEIIEEYEDRDIRTITYAIKMPSIIRFLNALKVTRHRVKFSRENIYARDDGKCQYCSTRVDRNNFTYDHVVPRSLGGTTTWTNVVTCCMGCNQKKGGRTPEQARMKLLTKPVQPKKLPYSRLTLMWRKNMPESWKQFLMDAHYWNGTLDEE